MINMENLSYSFPDKELYHKISFTLEDGQHGVLIGTSGSGKSTLIHLIMNPKRYLFDGKLEISPDCRIGYVSQFSELEKTEEITVFQYIGAEFIRLQEELASICTEMESAVDLEPLLEQYQQALDVFDALGGNDFESNMDKKLRLANLSKHRDRMVSQLSGGEFKLIQVIKEMLSSPDVMIMDEPDVFLDFENLNSLKNLLNAHKGTLLVITHNRYLLNHCFNKILHLENLELQEFDGRYLDYNFSLLESKVELQELANDDTLEIQRNEKLIDELRFIASYNTEASRGRALKARVKIQERLEARRIKAPFIYTKQPDICLHTENQLGDTIAVQVNDYGISFDEVLLEHVSFEMKATDKVAIIGENGTGKTTLLREIFINKHPSIEIHEGIKMAYLSQQQGEMLNESHTIREELLEVGMQTEEEIQAYMVSYGFDQEIIDQKIASLSGGEKNILQLAKISASNANLLLLDEPTSHLDIYAQIALENAIKNYEGAILMISHDFYSVVNCMDYVLLIEDKTIRKMSMRKFRTMIYSRHFDKGYLELEQKKTAVEMKIEAALKENDFALAKVLCEELGALIALL